YSLTRRTTASCPTWGRHATVEPSLCADELQEKPMQRRDALRLLAGIPAAALAGGWSAPVRAQVTRGFNQTLRAVASGEEIQRQPDLWIFEISFKPMRMIWVDGQDPQSGEATRDQVWYLAYRTVNRSLQARMETSNTTPQNELDPLPGPSPFLPEFL